MNFTQILERYLWIIITIIFAILVILGARTHPLWGDEAETALFGGSILTHGVPYGWDGVNIMGINNAVVLNSNLVNHTSPWLQYYLAAAGIALFGNTSVGVRAPFMVVSVLAMYVLYRLVLDLTSQKKLAIVALILMTCSVQFLLYSYQARHYMPSMLGALLLTWGAWGVYYNRKNFSWIFIVGGILYFYANYVSFVAWYIALGIALLWRGDVKRWIWRYTSASVVIGLATAPWFLSMQPFDTRGEVALPAIWTFMADLTGYFFHAVIEYHMNNVFPVTSVVLLAWMLWANRKKKEYIGSAIFLWMLSVGYLFVMALFTSLVSTDTSFVEGRYTVPVIATFGILSAYLLVSLYEYSKPLAWIYGALSITTTIFTLTGVQSLPYAYMQEVLYPYATANTMVAEYLSIHAKDGDTAWLSLERDYEPLLFALGKKIRFVNRVTLTNTRIFPKNRGTIPRYIYDYRDAPDWLIYYSDRGKDGTFMTFDYQETPRGVDLARDYEQIILPIFFSDFSRPELSRHSFVGFTATEGDRVFVYHKKSGIR